MVFFQQNVSLFLKSPLNEVSIFTSEGSPWPLALNTALTHHSADLGDETGKIDVSKPPFLWRTSFGWF